MFAFAYSVNMIIPIRTNWFLENHFFNAFGIMLIEGVDADLYP